jgi:hypothetical protein
MVSRNIRFKSARACGSGSSRSTRARNLHEPAINPDLDLLESVAENRSNGTVPREQFQQNGSSSQVWKGSCRGPQCEQFQLSHSLTVQHLGTEHCKNLVGATMGATTNKGLQHAKHQSGRRGGSTGWRHRVYPCRGVPLPGAVAGGGSAGLPSLRRRAPVGASGRYGAASGRALKHHPGRAVLEGVAQPEPAGASTSHRICASRRFGDPSRSPGICTRSRNPLSRILGNLRLRAALVSLEICTSLRIRLSRFAQTGPEIRYRAARIRQA